MPKKDKRQALVKREPDRSLQAIAEQVTGVAFSRGMGEWWAQFTGVPTERKDRCVIAYELLPLALAWQWIAIAHYLAGEGYSGDKIRPCLESYQRQSKTMLPDMLKETSEEYLARAYKVLESPNKLTGILYQFQGFIYSAFCRELLHRYGPETNETITLVAEEGKREFTAKDSKKPRGGSQ